MPELAELVEVLLRLMPDVLVKDVVCASARPGRLSAASIAQKANDARKPERTLCGVAEGIGEYKGITQASMDSREPHITLGAG